MEQPLVSVPVITYNSSKTVLETLESIKAQTYQNIEIVLVDDGSQDNSGKLCDKWRNTDSRIKVLHKENDGQAHARNDGIAASNGKYLMFIDPDDEIKINYYLMKIWFA